MQKKRFKYVTQIDGRWVYRSNHNLNVFQNINLYFYTDESIKSWAESYNLSPEAVCEALELCEIYSDDFYKYHQDRLKKDEKEELSETLVED